MKLTSDKRIWIPDDEDWYKWGEALYIKKK